MSLQPDEMVSRVGFGPRAVVWKLLLCSIGMMNGSCNYYVLYILTGSWFAHCQLTLPTARVTFSTYMRKVRNSIRHEIFKPSGE